MQQQDRLTLLPADSVEDAVHGMDIVVSSIPKAGEPPVREAQGVTLAIDQATRTNLELVRTLAGERTGSRGGIGQPAERNRGRRGEAANRQHGAAQRLAAIGQPAPPQVERRTVQGPIGQ